MSAGFPNMMTPYGPHGPASFCNGPTCAERCGVWVLDTLIHMHRNGLQRIDTTEEAKRAWKQGVDGIAVATLTPWTDSEYMGTNITGKVRECINYLGGFPAYSERIGQEIKDGWPRFVMG